MLLDCRYNKYLRILTAGPLFPRAPLAPGKPGAPCHERKENTHMHRRAKRLKRKNSQQPAEDSLHRHCSSSPGGCIDQEIWCYDKQMIFATISCICTTILTTHGSNMVGLFFNFLKIYGLIVKTQRKKFLRTINGIQISATYNWSFRSLGSGRSNCTSSSLQRETHA